MKVSAHQAAEQFLQASRLGMKEQSEPLLNLARNSYEPSRWASVTWSVAILILLFAVHEWAHAFTAFKLGDDTAAQQGRLTLNPIAHLDLFGSLLLPGLLLWRQSDLVFGWAKPVPVTPEKFADRRRDHMLVSFAGPAANLVVMLGAAVVLLLVMVHVRILSPSAQSLDLAMPSASISLAGNGLPAWIAPVIAFLKQLTITSLILACFNLIPMPPLDGSWILSGLLSEKSQAKLEAIRPYAFIIFLGLVFTSVFDYLLAIPVGFLWAGGAACFALMGFS
ncbi:MAG: site-2 protease family protein [Acidobacteriota bacterium]